MEKNGAIIIRMLGMNVKIYLSFLGFRNLRVHHRTCFFGVYSSKWDLAAEDQEQNRRS